MLLLLPVGLLAVGAALTALLRQVVPQSGRVLAPLFAWAAVAASIGVWVPQRAPLDLGGGEVGAGIRLAIHLDAVSFAFGLFVLVPVAFLLTFLRTPSPPLALLATATSLFTFRASGLTLAALGWSATLVAVAMLLQAGGEAKPMTTRLRDHAGVLCLLTAAAVIYSRAGTDQYGAIPVSALDTPTFGLVALAALLASGLVPWKAWPASLALRLRPETSGLGTALLFFGGFYFLLRLYEIGDGRYPSHYLNLLLAVLAVACLGAATLRAQAAAGRREYLVETLPITGGFALLALALGTPLGVAAAVATLATGALLCALLPLLLEQRLTTSMLLAVVLSAGIPPAALFGTRLLDLQAALEASEVTGYIAIAAAAAWVLGVAAAARAVRLPAARDSRDGPELPALLIGGLLVAGGALLGLVQSAVAIPAAATVMPFPSSALRGGLIATDAASGSWPAVALGGLLVLAVVVLGVAGRHAAAPPGGGSEQEPFFQPSWRSLPDRLGMVADALEIPEEFRITGWARIDAALTSGSIWLWLALTVALALVVTR